MYSNPDNWQTEL